MLTLYREGTVRLREEEEEYTLFANKFWTHGDGGLLSSEDPGQSLPGGPIQTADADRRGPGEKYTR